MLASLKIRRILQTLGYDGKQYCKIFPIVMFVFGVIFCWNAVWCVLYPELTCDTRETDVILLVLAVKDINMILSAQLISVDIMLMKYNIKRVLHVMDKGISMYSNHLPEEKRRLFLTREANQVNTLSKMESLWRIMIVPVVILPILAASLIVFQEIENTGNVDVNRLPLPITYRHPERYATIPVYVAVYVCQSTFVLFMFGQGFLVFGAVSSSFESVIISSKLLCFDVNNIDAAVSKYQDYRTYSSQLRDYTNYLIKCHQQIKKSVNFLTICVSRYITICNQAICSHVCAYLYCATEIDNTLAEVSFSALAILLSMAFLVYCKQGQNIIDASHEIKDTIYNCTWLEKPQWFKQDLQIMMSMLNVPLHIRPHGFYVLDLNTFTTIINASYSFYNVLRTQKV